MGHCNSASFLPSDSCKSSNLSSDRPSPLNFEQITLSVLFVCVGDSGGFTLFLNTKLSAEAHHLSVHFWCEWRNVCGWQEGDKNAKMQTVCVAVDAAGQWVVTCQENKAIHPLGLHNNVRVDWVCICAWGFTFFIYLGFQQQKLIYGSEPDDFGGTKTLGH